MENLNWEEGLYPTLSTKNTKEQVKQIMDLISYCDGKHSLLDIAEKINSPFWDLIKDVKKLISVKIIEKE